MEEREGGGAASDGDDLGGVGDDHEFIRRMIESMVDAERDLDVLFFDGPERRDDEDKPEMDENTAQEDLEWRRRADELGDSLRVGSADIVLRLVLICPSHDNHLTLLFFHPSGTTPVLADSQKCAISCAFELRCKVFVDSGVCRYRCFFLSICANSHIISVNAKRHKI